MSGRSTLHPRRLAMVGALGALAVASLSASPALAGVRAPAAATSSSSFSTFSLAQTPGVTCPGSAQCANTASEPAIRADGDGNFFAASENGLGAGTLAFRSTDGGAHYTTLTSPDATSATAATGLAPGGGDTDVAVAPVKNSSGHYNVYVASLSLADVTVSSSTDGGKTWNLNPLGATVPGDDREWIAADGANKVCVSYHDLATSNIVVDCSTDGGQTFTQLGDAIDTSHLYLVNNNEIGNLTIDPATHTIYQVFSGIDSATEAITGATGGAAYHDVWVGVSTDGGQTFTDYKVFSNPDPSVEYGHQFVNLTVDKAGNAYAVFTDDHNLFYAWSSDKGKTWSKPVQVNQAPSATAIMPWAAAGDAGKLDVVWYGTDFYDGKTTPDSYPASAQWHVYFAQNTAATTTGSTFTQSQATPVIHTGGVCESGVTCTGNRDLYDDFGVAVSPTTGLASIIYSDDQFDPNGPNSSGCTASSTNTSSCDHTMIATQTSGTSIIGATATASKVHGKAVKPKKRG